MAVSISYQPNAMLLGQAGYDTGLGEYLLQEQARQQAEQAAAQRQATVAQAGLRPPSQGRGGRDDYLARYAIMQRGALAEQENANQLAALDMRGQYALAEQNMRGQFGLQHEMMQQAGQNQREQWGNVSQSEIARRALIEKQMASDWQNIQKHLPYLNQAERDELIGKYHDRYRDAGMPMPVELPPQAIPDYMNPDVIWSQDNEYWDKQGLPRSVPDENGMPSRRGMPPWSQTKEGMAFQSDLKVQEKQAENALTKDADYAEFNRKAVDAELDFKTKANLSHLKLLTDYQTAKEKRQTSIANLQLKIAELKAKAADKDNPIVVDTTGMEATLKEMQTSLSQMMPPPPPAEMFQPGPLGSAAPSMPTPGIDNTTEVVGADPIVVTSQADLAALPPGTEFIFNGKRFRKK